MKQSIFNNIIPLQSGRHVIYNALTQKFIACMTPEMLDNGTLSLEKLAGYPDFLKQLREIGALVDKDFDEVDNLRRIIESVDNDMSMWQLHINPTLDCNFKCWYCYENHVRGSKMSPQTVEAVMRLIDRTLAEQKDTLKRFILSFFGGEPMIGFKKTALPLIEYAASKSKEAGIDFSTHFTTNAFLITDEIIDALKGYSVSFQITLDGGKELHDKTRTPADGSGSYTRILDNVRRLVSQGMYVVLRINYTSENIASVASVIDDLSGFDRQLLKHINVDFQRVWQDRKLIQEADVTELTEQYAMRLRELGIGGCSVYPHHAYVYTPCYGDRRNYQLINFDGGVYHCTARDFNDDNRHGTLQPDGSIEWKGDIVERRMALKFWRNACHTCRIAPLCGGGCRQQAADHSDHDGCIYSYTEEEKDAIVIDRFFSLIYTPE